MKVPQKVRACKSCHRPLIDPLSLSRGRGPVCHRKVVGRAGQHLHVPGWPPVPICPGQLALFELDDEECDHDTAA